LEQSKVLEPPVPLEVEVDVEVEVELLPPVPLVLVELLPPLPLEVQGSESPSLSQP
jgi:hypothetical protein